MGKYSALAEYLRGQAAKQEVLLTFKEIENILGFELPTSAKRHRCWWANDESHVQAKEGWMNAGWVVKTVNLKEEKATFSLKPEIKLLAEPKTQAKIYGRQNFAEYAGEIMSRHFGVKLSPKKRPEWPKLFDMVSSNASIVGEAAFIATEKARITPGTLAHITEMIWMLEKIDAKTKFIAFGGNEKPPKEWLKKYGKFAKEIQFFFIDKSGHVTCLNGSYFT